MRTLRRHKFVTLLGLSATCLSLVLLQSDRSATQIPNANQNTVRGMQRDAAISVMIADLKDPNPKVRVQAADWWLTHGGGVHQVEGVIPALVAALKDPNPEVRLRIAQSSLWSKAAQVQGVAPALLAALKDPNFKVRERIVAAIGDLEADVAVPALITALKDPNQAVRSTAVLMLERKGAAAKAAIPALIIALGDTEGDQIPDYAATALKTICSALNIVPPELIAALKAPNLTVRTYAATILKDLGTSAKVVVPALIASLRDPYTDARFAAVAALGEIGAPAKAAVPALARLLKDPDSNLRIQAARALWKLGEKPAVVLPTLIAAMKSPNDIVRFMAVSTLEDMGAAAKPATPALTSALKDKDADVRSEAERALTKIKGAQDGGIALLLIALKSPNSREQAISDLARLGAKAKPAVPTLLTILKQDPNYRVRRIVPFALVAISPNDKTVIATLIATLKERDDEVRASVAYALGEIGPAAQAAVPALVAALKAGSVANREIWEPVPPAVALVSIGAAQDVAVPALEAAFQNGTCNFFYGFCTNAVKALRKAGSDTKTASSTLVKLLSKAATYDQVSIALTLLELGAEIEPATTALVAVANRTEKSPISSGGAKADWSGSDRRYLAHRMAGMVESLQKNPYRLSAAEMAMTVARLEQVLQVLETPKEPKVSDATLERIRRSLDALKVQQRL